MSRRKPRDGALKHERVHRFLSGLTLEKLLHAPFWRERCLGLRTIASHAFSIFEEGQQPCDRNVFIRTNEHVRSFSVACRLNSSRIRDTRRDICPPQDSSPAQDLERIER